MQVVGLLCPQRVPWAPYRPHAESICSPKMLPADGGILGGIQEEASGAGGRMALLAPTSGRQESGWGQNPSPCRGDVVLGTWGQCECGSAQARPEVHRHSPHPHLTVCSAQPPPGGPAEFCLSAHMGLLCHTSVCPTIDSHSGTVPAVPPMRSGCPCGCSLCTAAEPPQPLPRSLPMHPRHPCRGGIIWGNHGNPGMLHAVPGFPQQRDLVQLSGRWGCLCDAQPTSLELTVLCGPGSHLLSWPGSSHTSFILQSWDGAAAGPSASSAHLPYPCCCWTR